MFKHLDQKHEITRVERAKVHKKPASKPIAAFQGTGSSPIKTDDLLNDNMINGQYKPKFLHLNEDDTHKDVKSSGNISEKQHLLDAKSRSMTIPIIKSSVDSGFDIGTGFEFKGYAYRKLNITPDPPQPEY